MSDWNNTIDARRINCNGRTYDCETITTGEGLVTKIKEIARENSIEKFDVVDSTGVLLSTAQVRNLEFQGDITIVRFNKAA